VASDSERDPRCTRCGGILKLDTVLFGERLDPARISQAVAIATATPLLLAVGSSLVVEPAAQLCRLAVDRGARLVVVNRDRTAYDEVADEVIRGDITEVLPTLIDGLIEARRTP
jgi:NAD-dependent deacetylase